MVNGANLQPRRRMHLVEQPAIDRCLWAKENDVALGVTEEVERIDERKDLDPNNFKHSEGKEEITTGA